MKIFSTSQIRLLDQYTIEHEPIASIDLMERAAEGLYEEIKHLFPHKPKFVILAGAGNNGGDGLALARLMLSDGWGVQAVLFHNGNLSADCETNKNRLAVRFPAAFSEQTDHFTALNIDKNTVIVDALFGSGLNRPLEGIFAETVRWINSVDNQTIAVDIPSGMHGEQTVKSTDLVVKADATLTLQFPKLGFFFAENEPFVGAWKVIDIQLHPKAIEKESTQWRFTEKSDIVPKLKKRSKFAHKGNFGHVCLMAGSKGMAGAAVLSASAALRSGAGLVTVFGTEENRVILQIAVPEAMYKTDLNNLENYSVFAFGPGIGTKNETKQILEDILSRINSKLSTNFPLGGWGASILDADALNIISQYPDFWNIIPQNTIITPHPKEFERLFGTSENSLERVRKASAKAVERQIVIVLKGAYTAVCCPDGKVHFNSTGNAGMATGGMGDVLTGIIAGLLAQGYSAKDSALAGVYLHGLAADLALETQSEESLLARDVVENVGRAYHFLRAYYCK